MEGGIYSYVLRYSKKEQIILIVAAAISFPFYFFSLDIPKQIVDDAIKGTEFPNNYYGLEMEQVPFLMLLCFMFLLLVFINGGFKYFINVYRGAAGERMLRRLRFQLIERVMRFPLSQFRKTSQGEVVSMVTLETEPLGGFFGEAFSLPSFQGGMLVTLMIFMFVQDWKLGIAAIALYPIQAYLIPKLQRSVNLLGKERVKTVRRLSERIGETVTGATEIHANDTSQFELADFSARLGKIYAIRFEIYRKKFFIKFVNNFLALLTPFFFYSIGGWLVIRGDMSMGSLIAVLGAYKDVSAPWKMLLTYYQRKEDARIKYETIVEKFEFPGLLDADKQIDEPEEKTPITGRLVASNISWTEDDGLRLIDGASMSMELPSHFAVIGPSGGGKTELAQMMARLVEPSGGKISIGDRNFSDMSETVTGRQLSYSGQSPYIFGGTIRDNLLYGLKHRPLRDAEYEGDAEAVSIAEREAALESGNSPYDLNASWIDLTAAGAESEENLIDRSIHYLDLVSLKEDVYQMGLRQTMDPSERADLTCVILEARVKMRATLDERSLEDFVESFDKDKFNTNASIAENILFGTPVGPDFTIDHLGENEYVLGVLNKVGLSDEFLNKGHKLAGIMVDLFQGLPPDHEFFERFSFIGSDDLPDFQAILTRISQSGLDNIPADDRSRLMSLPFKLIPAKHHLELVDDEFKERLLEARQEFEKNLSDDMKNAVEFFDATGYNAAASIQDNILFGKMASERAGSAERVGEVMAQVVEETGLTTDIIDLGLGFNVGIGGSRLSAVQRQKLSVARSLIKQPDFLIMNEALSNLDLDNQSTVLDAILEEQQGRSLLVVPSQADANGKFDQVFTMEGGKITGAGDADDVGAVEDAAPVSEEMGGGFGEEIDVLANIPMFAGLDRSRLKLLSFASERYNYDIGQKVFLQGDIGDKAYVIIEGAADVVLETMDGPKTLVTMKRNDLFGELALLCDAPRTATIIAAERLSVMSIAKDVFVKLVAEDVDMSARLTRAVAERLERTTQDLSKASAVRDIVTNLPDSRLFADRMRVTLARTKRFGEVSGILWFDVGRNFDLDANLAEDQRNKLLREIADRLETCTRDTDTAARVSDEKFAIIVSPVNEERSPQLLGQRIADLLSESIVVDDLNFSINSECEFFYRELDDTDPENQLEYVNLDDGNRLDIKGRV